MLVLKTSVLGVGILWSHRISLLWSPRVGGGKGVGPFFVLWGLEMLTVQPFHPLKFRAHRPKQALQSTP